jgi:hypothetical protein
LKPTRRYRRYDIVDAKSTGIAMMSHSAFFSFSIIAESPLFTVGEFEAKSAQSIIGNAG